MKPLPTTIAALILCLPSVAWCAEVPGMGSMFLKMTWALLVVAGLILILYGLLRRKMGLTAAGGSAINIIEIKPVMYKNALALIKVRDREMLIGINQNEIRLLTEFPETAPSPATFEETLKRNDSQGL